MEHRFRKCVMIGAGAVFASCSFAASTVYVDRNRSDDSGDGLTPGTAFRTIQAGVNAVDAGGKVVVLPGVYDEGVTAAGAHDNRVFIDKSLTLVAEKGSAVTQIVGAKDPDTTADPKLCGVGPKGVRCILVGSANHVVVIQGFTLRDGASDAGKDMCSTWGGGVAVDAPTAVIGPGFAYKTTLVDCAIRDCVAERGGGTRKVRAVRTVFENCRGLKNGDFARDGQFYWCVFRDGGRSSALSDVTLVNCTLLGCGVSAIQKQVAENKVYNTVLGISKGKNGGAGVTVVDSVADAGQLLGPAVCDFRPIAGGSLDGKGNRAHLELIPEEFRGRDFLGNALEGNAALHVGAVQTSGKPVGGKIEISGFNASDLTVLLDGHAIRTPGQYVYATAWPTQYEAKVVSAVGGELWGWRSRTTDSAKFPEMGNSRTLLMPMAKPSEASVYEPVLADMIFYVKPDGDDKNNGRSRAKAFQTLQQANERAPKGKYTLVHVAEGVYDKGGYVWSEVLNRLTIRNQVRFLGAGAGKSVIKGAADPAGADTHSGCGAAAARCVAARDVCCAVQGFTLTDGHSTIGGGDQAAKVTATGASVRGGGFYALSDKACLIDCEIRNCAANRGAGAYGGSLIRCRFSDLEVMANSSGNAIVRDCLAWGCTFYNVQDGGSAVLFANGRYFNCSLALGDKNVANLNDPSKVRVYNSLCSGRPFVGKDKVYFGCLANDPKRLGFVDAASGDLRITVKSKAIGSGVATDDPAYARICDWGIDGVRPLFANGRPTAGAYQDPVR